MKRGGSRLALVVATLGACLSTAALALSSATGAPVTDGPGLAASTSTARTYADGAVLSGDSKANCVYPASSLAELATLSQLTGQTFNCVLLYNNDKPTWADWTNVWWLDPPSPDNDWTGWLQAQPGRQLIISQPMVPEDAPSNWAALGAAGDYDTYATQLATNLVNERMGNAVIRLGWEANDTADPYNDLGTDASQYTDWAQYWANIVTSMRAVPGADFQFDWTVNQYYRPIPFQDWYPGDNVVDIIGIDAYDSGVYQSGLSPTQRWADLYNEPDGLAAIAAFAAAHGKPLSIPEWGLADSNIGGAGDDPTYVQGLASFIAQNNVEYNSYFYSDSPDDLVYLPDAPQSLAAYRQDFAGITPSTGDGTTSTTGATGTPVTTAPGATTTVPTTSGSTTVPNGAPTTSVAGGTSGQSGPGASPSPAGATEPSTTAAGPASPQTPTTSPPSTVPGNASPGRPKGVTGPYSPHGTPGASLELVTSGGEVVRVGSKATTVVNTNWRGPHSPVVAAAPNDDGHGYWLAASSGAVFAFGDARTYPGPDKPAGHIVSVAATPDGHGYWLAASSGAVFAFGDARTYRGPDKPAGHIVSVAATPDGHGYWLAASSGAVFAFGDARTYRGPDKPAGHIVSVAATPDGHGYWLAASSGAVFAFGDARTYRGPHKAPGAVTALVRSLSGHGYWTVSTTGQVSHFGDAAAMASAQTPDRVMAAYLG